MFLLPLKGSPREGQFLSLQQMGFSFFRVEMDLISSKLTQWVLSSLLTAETKGTPAAGGRTIWPHSSGKHSHVVRPSVTLTARIPVCSHQPVLCRLRPNSVGSHSLREHLFCQQNQDLGRLIFPGQHRVASPEVCLIFSACLWRL